MSLSSFLKSTENYLSIGFHWLLNNGPKAAQEAANLAPLAVAVESVVPGAQTAIAPTLAAASALGAIAKAGAELHSTVGLPTDPTGTTSISISNQTLLDVMAVLPAASKAAEAITGKPLPSTVATAVSAAGAVLGALTGSSSATAGPQILGGPGPVTGPTK